MPERKDDKGNGKPTTKRLEIRKDLIKKLSRDELQQVKGASAGCCEYWCGRSCLPLTIGEALN